MARELTYEELEHRVKVLEKKALEKKRCVKMLSESEEKYRRLVENMHEVIYTVDTHGVMTWVSPATELLLGYRPSEIIGRSFTDFIYRQDLLRMKKRFQEVLLGQIIPTEYRIVKKSGEYLWVLTFSKPIVQSGGVVAIQGVLTDINEQKKVEKTLREQMLRNELMLETLMDGFCVIDSEGKILEVNDAACKNSGFSKEEMVSMKISDLEFQETPRETTQHIKKVIKTGYDRFETKHQRKDGRILDIEVSTNFLKIGKKRFFFSFFRDIMERKQAEQALKERATELEMNAKSLEEANIALRVLLKIRNEDIIEVEEKVLCNLKELVEPSLEFLRKSGINKRQIAYIDILESNLGNIISSFSRTLSSKYLNLTPVEIQTASLVRQGKTTKEIAEILNVSSKTVEFHRDSIREKVGIKHKRTNLRSYLLTLE
jgi:PAS domain S-box-containing protein